MSGKGRHRGRGMLAILAGVTLAAMTGLPAYAGTSPHATSARAATASPQSPAREAVLHAKTPAVREALTSDYAAQARARITRRPVLVSADTTEVSQTTANPDGSFTYTNTLMP